MDKECCKWAPQISYHKRCFRRPACGQALALTLMVRLPGSERSCQPQQIFKVLHLSNNVSSLREKRREDASHNVTAQSDTVTSLLDRKR
jgi:hypothetical protein